jgi:hypothetical protein
MSVEWTSKSSAARPESGDAPAEAVAVRECSSGFVMAAIVMRSHRLPEECPQSAARPRADGDGWCDAIDRSRFERRVTTAGCQYPSSVWVGTRHAPSFA